MPSSGFDAKATYGDADRHFADVPRVGVPAHRAWWLLARRRARRCGTRGKSNTIVAVMPARDEADVIAASAGSLITQQYRGEFSVIVVDDHSDDATRTTAERVAAVHSNRRLTVLSAPTLAEGWSGKLWALEHGIRIDNVHPQLVRVEGRGRYHLDAPGDALS